MKRKLMSPLLVSAALALAACEREEARETAAPSEEAYAPGAVEQALAEPPVALSVETPEPNARRGRILFVTRACVICHEVNGVGGRAAPSLQARPSQTSVNPLAFSARMWDGAVAMAALQSAELGYVIDLDAQDIADLAAFASSSDEQKLLTLESVPADLRDWFINERYWENEDWADYLARGGRIPKVEEGDVE